MASKRFRSADGDATAAEMVKRRRFYIVPKDQQKILDRGNASYQSLKQRSGGLRHNIPSSVLDGIMAQHHRNNLADDKAEKSSDLPSSTHQALCNSDDQCVTTNETPRSSGPRSQHDRTKSSNPQLLQSPSPSSSPEGRMSWSPSPASHRFRAGILVSEKVEETPAAQRPNAESATVKTRPQIDYNFPSSDGPEDELEVDIPDAQNSFGPPIDVPAIHARHLASSPLKHIHMVQNTPPCAQPPPAVIPSTLDQGIRMSAPNDVQPRKKLCWKPVLFSDEITPEKPTNARTRMPATEAFQMEASEMQSSNSTESSMVVPATLEPRHHGASIHGEDHVQTRAVLTEVTCQAAAEPHFSQESRQHASKGGRRKLLVPDVTEPEGPDEGQRSATIANDEFCSHAPLTQVLSRTPASSTGTLAADVPVDNNPDASISAKSPSMGNALPETMDPYKHFTDVYPSYESVYNGCLLHFIRATAILESLRSQMALKSVLYDDFVRAFSDGYVPYVQETGPNRESQPAFQWYNWKDEPILFTQAVLSRKNLDLVRLAYPAEYSKAKKFTTEGNSEFGLNCKSPVVVHETLEARESKEAYEIAHTNLGESDRPRKHKTNGQYPPSKSAALKPPSNSRLFLSQDNAGDQSCKTSSLSAIHGLTEVNGTSYDSSAHASQSNSNKVVMGNSTLRQRGAKVVSAKSGSLSPGGGTSEVAGDEPVMAPYASETAATMHSAVPNPQERMGNRASSAPMETSDVASKASRAMSNLPPSSSMISIRRTCSSSATTKPRPRGLAYLQKLRTKGGSDEARDARMRELGRAKRLSRVGSVASSHASSK